ncbi:Lactonase, 7-bladed beta-propeller-domain-containing protein [Schizophyllum amplum]|uniref:Lactonase, 7-bladed beta-propeller-domain-containing protein n=1 Tax=Schizophyllum amplum TaxID=97359 RepID=A0A550CYF1_9AGAR|nr:Lactonase, 7-bladed beta-propeller-domain-containing protein [Auriculariopsis ampla]
MVYHILVGSYTNNIVTLAFDAEKGTLEQVAATKAGKMPSWLAAYPKDNSLIYAALEQEEGKVVVFRYDVKHGEGTLVAEKSTGGHSPCALWVTKDELFAANYISGSVAILPITPELPYFVDSAREAIELRGSGPNAERQEHSHAHHAIHYPEYDELFIADLGADKAWRFKKEGDQWIIRGEISYSAGLGPRHFALHDGILYTVGELSGAVTAHSVPPLPKEAELLDTLPLATTRTDAMLAAELLIPPPSAAFPTPYIYVSDRNDPSPEGDLISIIAPVDASKKLKMIAQVRSGLKHLRGMVFGGPDDKYLIAAGQNGGGVKVFERIDGGKGLKEVAAKADVESATHFLWL